MQCIIYDPLNIIKSIVFISSATEVIFLLNEFLLNLYKERQREREKKKQKKTVPSQRKISQIFNRVQSIKFQLSNFFVSQNNFDTLGR